MAPYFRERVDGQYDGTVLNVQSRESVDNFRFQLSEEDC